MDSIGRALANAGVTANSLTVLGFVFALLAGFLFAYIPGREYLAALAIIASGIMDILDGSVARVTGKVSALGSFSDSTLDRISEVAIFAGIAYAGYTLNSAVIVLALGLSLLVSYLRAKAESLGFTMSGIGIGERAERLLVLIVFAIVGYIWIGVYLVLLLAGITCGQRLVYALTAIRKKNSSSSVSR